MGPRPEKHNHSVFYQPVRVPVNTPHTGHPPSGDEYHMIQQHAQCYGHKVHVVPSNNG